MIKTVEHTIGVIPQEIWGAPQYADVFRGQREYYRPMLGKVISDIFASKIDPSEPVLELCSGFGELRRHIPQTYLDQLVHLDASPYYVAEMQQHYPEASIVLGDATHTNFPDSTFGSIVVLAGFDVLSDLHQAAQEVHRLLKPGGTFVHILDLRPEAKPIISEKYPERIPFPLCEQGLVTGFTSVPTEEVATAQSQLLESLGDDLRQKVSDYLADPINLFKQSTFDANAFSLLSRFALNCKGNVWQRGFANLFGNRLKQALTGSQFTQVTEEKIDITEKAARPPLVTDLPINYIFNNVGGIEMGSSRCLPWSLKSNEIAMRLRAQIILAQK